MYKALNKKDGTIYPIWEWMSNTKFIDKNSEERKFNTEPTCFVCNNTLSIRPKGGSAKSENIHFWHNKHGTGCPTIEKNRLRYIGLKETKADKGKSDNIKIDFIKNIYKVYLKCNKICDNKLSIKEYIKLINNFTKENIWSYRNIQITDIPYMLLHLTCNIKEYAYFVLMPYSFPEGELWIDSKIEKYLLKIENVINKSNKYSISEDFLYYDEKPTMNFNGYFNKMLQVVNIKKELEEKAVQAYCDYSNSIIER